MKYGEIDEVCEVSNLFVSVENYSVIAERLYSSGSSGMRHVLGKAKVQNSKAILTVALPLCAGEIAISSRMGGDRLRRINILHEI